MKIIRNLRRKSVFFFISLVIISVLTLVILLNLYFLIEIIRKKGTRYQVQFCSINFLFELLMLLGIGCFLLILWKRLFSEKRKKLEPKYKRIFLIILLIGGLILLIFIPLTIIFSTIPFGFVLNTILRIGIIFYMFGWVMLLADKIEKQKMET